MDDRKCPHCDPTHGSPHRVAWGVRLGPALAANATGPVEPLALERDSDGQPVYLYVAPTDGAHVAQEDADWLFALMRDSGQLERLRTAAKRVVDLTRHGSTELIVGAAIRDLGHRDFDAHVSVNRLYEGEEIGPPDAYMAEIRVMCVNCGEPFRWTGVQAGLSPARPMCSVDESELRAPLRPASADPDFGLGLPGFAVTWKEAS